MSDSKTLNEHGLKVLKYLDNNGCVIGRTDNFLDYCYNINCQGITKTITIELLNNCDKEKLLVEGFR